MSTYQYTVLAHCVRFSDGHVIFLFMDRDGVWTIRDAGVSYFPHEYKWFLDREDAALKEAF